MSAYPPAYYPGPPQQGVVTSQPAYYPGPPQPGYNYGGMAGDPQNQWQPPPQPQWQQPNPYQTPQYGLAPDNCPPGLEYLTQIDQIIVKQKVELLEALLGCETKNKYKVKNSMGQDIYKAKEETDCCTRNVCGPIRPFDLSIRDNNDREVIHLYRPLNCQSCFFPCCLQYLEVSSPPGTVIGSIQQEWSLCAPQFVIRDNANEIALRIEGPVCTYSICGDVEFKVLSPDGTTEVGKISKHWSGLLREAFTDADNFGISFPMDLDVRMKATLLGALFLIDFMFFEKKQNEENDQIGMF